MRKLDVLVIVAVAITFAGMIGAAVAFTWLNAQGRPETERPIATVEAEQARRAGSWCDAAAGVCTSQVEPGRFVAVTWPAEGGLYRFPVSLSDGRIVVDLGRRCADAQGYS